MSSQEMQHIPQKKMKMSTDPDEEPKTYINFYFCKLSLNILYTITYVTAAVFLNIVNRLVFYKYHFNNYNYTFMLLQQIFCIIFFYLVSHKSETFKSQAGEITFADFYALKHYYISFAIVFMLNTIVIFVGTQMIINASMFQTLRKLVLVKVYFIDLCYGYKKITCFTTICVFMVTIGSILAGVDTFSRDYAGIALTMVSNFINVAYNKFTESFRRKTGVPNLKLLVYNSYISGPCLFVLIFLTGEYKKLITYFTEEKYLGENQVEGSFYGFIIMLSISCTLCIVLNSSFFMSNEKNSSLFTQLLANTKDLFTCILSRFILAGNKFTFNIVSGLVISTIGAMMFSMKSICDNMISGSLGKKKEENDNEEANISQDSNIPAQNVEIKSEEGSP
jgi:drug/metabolite transporter (DMT)-like permease